MLIVAGLPLVCAEVAGASVPLSITACSFTPSSISLATGQSENITFDWQDGVNTPGAMDDSYYQEVLIDGQAPFGNVWSLSFGSGAVNPVTEPYTFEMLSSVLSDHAGTVKYSFYATDGTTKVGSELCSLTATVAAPPASTTTTTVVPTTLAATGSNTGTFVAGGIMILVFGGALYVSGRRRSIK